MEDAYCYYCEVLFGSRLRSYFRLKLYLIILLALKLTPTGGSVSRLVGKVSFAAAAITAALSPPVKLSSLIVGYKASTIDVQSILSSNTHWRGNLKKICRL